MGCVRVLSVDASISGKKWANPKCFCTSAGEPKPHSTKDMLINRRWGTCTGTPKIGFKPKTYMLSWMRIKHTNTKFSRDWNFIPLVPSWLRSTRVCCSACRTNLCGRESWLGESKSQVAKEQNLFLLPGHCTTKPKNFHTRPIMTKSKALVEHCWQRASADHWAMTVRSRGGAEAALSRCLQSSDCWPQWVQVSLPNHGLTRTKSKVVSNSKKTNPKQIFFFF